MIYLLGDYEKNGSKTVTAGKSRRDVTLGTIDGSTVREWDALQHVSSGVEIAVLVRNLREG